jgi:hypothetical protein
MVDLVEQGVITGTSKTLHPRKMVSSFAMGTKKQSVPKRSLPLPLLNFEVSFLAKQEQCICFKEKQMLAVPVISALTR